MDRWIARSQDASYQVEQGWYSLKTSSSCNSLLEDFGFSQVYPNSAFEFFVFVTASFYLCIHTLISWGASF
jgi:hypothetical protein